MKALDDYFKLQQEIFEYFGYREDWAVIPLNDCRKYFWCISGDDYGDCVCFAKTEEDLDRQSGDYYEDVICTLRHLPKFVYRSKEYTLVVVDTRTDGNNLLSVFSNEKERKPLVEPEDEIKRNDNNTFEDALKIARGCLDYNGCYRRDKEKFEIYQHGIQTVINALELASKNPQNTQVVALYKIGAQHEMQNI